MRNPSSNGGWWTDALCRGLDGNIWFPEKPQGRDYFAVARSYCRRCPVRVPCLEEALSFDQDFDRFGMYGGMSPKERARLREGDTTPTARFEIALVAPKPPTPPDPPKARVFSTVPVQPRRRGARDITREYLARNKPDWGELALRKKATRLVNKDIPKQTRLVMEVTPTIGASELTAQAAAAIIMAGWEDPIEARTAAAFFMGASYVAELGRQGAENGALTPQEGAVVQGVAELAMQVWKYHALHAKVEPASLLENHG